MIKEGVRLNYLNSEIERLEKMYDGISHSPYIRNKSRANYVLNSISKKLEKLKTEKGRWEELYAKANEPGEYDKFFTKIKEGMDTPPPIIQQSNHLSKDFVNFVKTEENSAKVGFNSEKGLWFPYKDPSKNNSMAIAYGHQIKNTNELNQLTRGITDKQAEELLQHDLEFYRQKVYQHIEKVYKVKLKLTPVQEEMLTEFYYNLGTLSSFPKFVDAVVRQDWNKAKLEYQRSYTQNGQKHLMQQRNQQFFNRYFKSTPLKEGMALMPGNYFDVNTNRDRQHDMIRTQRSVFNNRLKPFGQSVPPSKLFIGAKFNDYALKHGAEKVYGDLNFRTLINKIRQTLKFPYGSKEKESNIIQLIDSSLDKFNNLINLNEFDIITAAPSSSKLNDLILRRISIRILDRRKIKRGIFIKNRVSGIQLLDDFNKLSPKVQKHYIEKLSYLFAKRGDEEFQIKFLGAQSGMRQFVKNFIISKMKKRRNAFVDKKVLVIDDTFGSGATFADIQRILGEYRAKEVYFFALLKDYK